MELVTTHTHTCYTGHGEGSVEELVAAAEAAGITTIAVTEHYPLSDAFDDDCYLSMGWDKVSDYLIDIVAAQVTHPGIEVVAGTELDLLADEEDRELSEEDFAPFGLVLGSVHFIDGWAFDNPNDRDRWDEVGVDGVWRRYFEIWCQAASAKGPYQVMAHPDLVKKFGYYPSFDLQTLYDEAAQACASGGRMIEVNTSGSYYDCREMFPAPALLATFCRAGVPCTVGTDAHTPANVARDIPDAYKLMYEAGYREVTVPTADGDRRTIPLE